MIPTFLRPVAALACLLPCSARAIAQGSVTPFGTGCAGMALSATNPPRLGQPLRLQYAGPIGSHFLGFYSNLAQVYLLLGLSNTQAGGVPLPFPLAPSLTGGASCDVLVSPDVQIPLPMPTAPPPHGLSLAIPADQGLLGLTFHGQWLLISERSLFTQVLWVLFATSNAATFVVGL